MKQLFIIISLLFLSKHASAQCKGLVWSDEFDGNSINTANWSHETGGGGWGNNELEYYTSRPENSYVSGGNLYITAKAENYTGPDGVTRSYTSARLKTQGKARWTYGRFEVRAKLPKGKGVWPAIWMMPDQSVYGSWPASGEIDIMEMLGHEINHVYGTIHYGANFSQHHSSGSSYILPSGNFSDSYHVFAVEWDSTSIKWLVDDYTYFTRTKAQIAPDAWPFDKDFYFILNVAVGGDWPGAPDNTTTFPQSMVVDYARVYQDMNANTVKINGSSSVFENQATTYTVPYLAGIAYQWTVPSDAQIVSGENTNRVTVRWGKTSGNVGVSYTTSCGSKTLELPVQVYEGVCGYMFEDFETSRSSYSYMTGSFQQAVANPGANTINNSPHVGKYTRNASSQYDVLALVSNNIGAPADYSGGTKKISMEVFSPEPGITINVQLENKTLAAQAYPSGRFLIYTGTTTKTNEWEKLNLTVNTSPDPSVTSLDQITILFAPNTYTNQVFYLDNLYSYSDGACDITSGLLHKPAEEKLLTLYPNPAKEEVTISLKDQGKCEIELLTMEGKSIMKTTSPDGEESRISLKALIPGIYIIKVVADEKVIQEKLVVE